MKKIIFIIAIMAMFAGCAKNNEAVNVDDKTPHFRALFAEDATRTFIDEQIRLRWMSDDRITIFVGTTRNKQFAFAGETGDNAGDFNEIKSASFGTGNDVERHYAVYPYISSTKLDESGYITYTFPAIQSYAVDSFGAGANTMVAVTEDLDDFDLRFRNVCGYLKLQLYGTEQAVKSIVIKGNTNEKIAGKAKIIPVTNGAPTTEMQSTATSVVTLDCGDGVMLGGDAQSATTFWIVIPPVTFKSGFSITINGLYGGAFVKSTAKSITVERNKYFSMSALPVNIAIDETGMGVGSWNNDAEDYGGMAE